MDFIAYVSNVEISNKEMINLCHQLNSSIIVKNVIKLWPQNNFTVPTIKKNIQKEN